MFTSKIQDPDFVSYILSMNPVNNQCHSQDYYVAVI